MRRLGAIAAVGIGLLLSSCAAQQGERETLSDQPPSESVNEASFAEPVFFDTPEGEVRVPPLVGLTYPEAQEVAEDLGLRLSGGDVSDDDRMIWVEGNWTVVGQSTEPGLGVRAGARIEVDLLKTDEAQDSIDAESAENKHWNERVFSGFVTAYEDPAPSWQESITTIVVDGAVVELDLIWLYSTACWGADEVDASAAIALKEELLPVGAPVQVVRSESTDERGFIHRLDAETLRPLAQPPAGSANEELVRSGLWAPFDAALNWSDVQYGMASDYSVSDEVSGTRAEYAALIASAGTETRAARIGEVGHCADETVRILADQSANLDQQRREQEEYSRRIQALIESGAYNCRDGDGDGRCYER